MQYLQANVTMNVLLDGYDYYAPKQSYLGGFDEIMWSWPTADGAAPAINEGRYNVTENPDIWGGKLTPQLFSTYNSETG